MEGACAQAVMFVEHLPREGAIMFYISGGFFMLYIYSFFCIQGTYVYCCSADLF